MQTISYEENGLKYVEVLLENRNKILVWKGKTMTYIITVYWSESGKTFQLNCNCRPEHYKGICHHRKNAAAKFNWVKRFEPQGEWARVNEAYLVNYLQIHEERRAGKLW